MNRQITSTGGDVFMKKKIAIISFIVCILFALSAIASSPTNYKALYEKLLKDYNNLKTENQKLKNDIALLKKKNEELQKKISSMPQLSYYDVLINGISTAQKVPFISYGGRRYVHFDSILKTFLNVGDMGYIFNDQAKRVEIGAFVKNKNGVWLSDLEYFDKEGIYSDFGFNATDVVINGKKFYKNIWWKEAAYQNNKFRLIYKLHGKYTKLQFKYGVLDFSGKGVRGAVRIYGDNELLGEYTCELYDDPKSATVNIAGVNYLTIEFESLVDNGEKIYMSICDPLLIP